MSNNSDLTVIEQREVDFYDDVILAVRVQNGEIYVPIRPICEILGISWPSQRNRINRDLILSEVAQSVVIQKTNVASNQRGPRVSEMLALPLSHINGWLFGMNPSRAKEAVRPLLLQYQRDCYRVLSETFLHNRITHRPMVDIDTYLEESDAPTAVAYRHAMAIANLAREQAMMRLEYDNLNQSVQEHSSRLDIIEAQLGNSDRFVTQHQASQIAQGVRTVANELGSRTGRNEYGGVYNELHRLFKITGYKRLPAAQYEEAMAFLRQWYESLVDDDREIPF